MRLETWNEMTSFQARKFHGRNIQVICLQPHQLRHGRQGCQTPFQLPSTDQWALCHQCLLPKNDRSLQNPYHTNAAQRERCGPNTVQTGKYSDYSKVLDSWLTDWFSNTPARAYARNVVAHPKARDPSMLHDVNKIHHEQQSPGKQAHCALQSID